MRNLYKGLILLSVCVNIKVIKRMKYLNIVLVEYYSFRKCL